MTNQLPEIQVSFRMFAILKIIFLVSVFVVVTINILSVNAIEQEEEYQFVHCFNEVTNSTFTYPENTVCELTDDNLEEQEEIDEEEEHEKESRDD